MQLPIFILNDLIFDDESMASDLESVILDLGEAVGFCVHSVWTGSPDGDVIVQVSNFLDDSSSFVDIDTQATGGAAGKHILNVEHAHYRYIKVIFDRTSGSGSLKCRVSAKRA